MPNPPEIVHSKLQEPSYCRQLDRVTLPHVSQFQNVEEYFVSFIMSSRTPRRTNAA